MANLIGRGWVFPPRINNSGNVALTSGETEIHQAIHIILSTAPGERVMRPDFGCLIHELVFAPNNQATHATAERYVREALGRWEPRINVLEVRANAAPGEVGVMAVEVDYVIKGTHDPRSLVFPFYLLPDQA